MRTAISITLLAAATAIALVPPSFELSSWFFGDMGDTPYFIWNIWEFYSSLRDGSSPFYTTSQLVPFGGSTMQHTYVPLHGLLATPLLAFLPLVTTSNLLILLEFFLSAVGAYLLGRMLTKSHIAGILAGVIFAFAPFKFAHLAGHYNLIATGALPFVFYFALKVLLKPSRPQHAALGLAVSLLACLLSDYYYFTGAVLSLVFIYGLSARRLLSTCEPLLLAKLVLYPVFACLPYVVLYIVSAGEGSFTRCGGEMTYVNDLAGFLVPPAYGSWYPEFVRSWKLAALPGGAVESEAFLGWTALVLFAIALVYIIGRRAGHLVVLACTTIAMFWLSAGATVYWFGDASGIFSLYRLVIEPLPGLSDLRAPSRFVAPGMLGFAALAAVGWSRLAVLLRRKRIEPGVVSAIGLSIAALVCFETLPADVLRSKSQVPGIVREMASTPAEGSLLPIPFGARDGCNAVGSPHNSVAALHSTVHGRPIIGGMLARLPQHLFYYYRNVPLLGALDALAMSEIEDKPTQASEPPSADEVAALIEATNLREVLIYPSATRAEKQLALAAFAPFVTSRSEGDGYQLLRLAQASERAGNVLTGAEIVARDYQRGWSVYDGKPLVPQGSSISVSLPQFAAGATEVVVRLSVSERVDPALLKGLAYTFEGSATQVAGIRYGIALLDGSVDSSSVELRLAGGGDLQVRALPMGISVQSAAEPKRRCDIHFGTWSYAGSQIGLTVAWLPPGDNTPRVRSFDSYHKDAQVAEFAELIESLSPGTVVAIASVDEASKRLTERALVAIESVGGSRGLGNCFRCRYALIGRRGMNAGEAIEQISVEQKDAGVETGLVLLSEIEPQ